MLRMLQSGMSRGCHMRNRCVKAPSADNCLLPAPCRPLSPLFGLRVPSLLPQNPLFQAHRRVRGSQRYMRLRL
jgi:hypothetical protein